MFVNVGRLHLTENIDRIKLLFLMYVYSCRLTVVEGFVNCAVGSVTVCTWYWDNILDIIGYDKVIAWPVCWKF